VVRFNVRMRWSAERHPARASLTTRTKLKNPPPSCSTWRFECARSWTRSCAFASRLQAPMR